MARIKPQTNKITRTPTQQPTVELTITPSPPPPLPPMTTTTDHHYYIHHQAKPPSIHHRNAPHHYLLYFSLATTTTTTIITHYPLSATNTPSYTITGATTRQTPLSLLSSLLGLCYEIIMSTRLGEVVLSLHVSRRRWSGLRVELG
ncbi:hypothetical protein E2C01_036621 [Portunus trituberculatus]|uniref:Uncharacterized protein n=1 Tax=Portunus trituberculatus TaxID=210409 RepID=A0A5B7FCF9_PORTR|nr:hypothetical protein [Portunus trituberculatus]